MCTDREKASLWVPNKREKKVLYAPAQRETPASYCLLAGGPSTTSWSCTNTKTNGGGFAGNRIASDSTMHMCPGGTQFPHILKYIHVRGGHLLRDPQEAHTQTSHLLQSD